MKVGRACPGSRTHCSVTIVELNDARFSIRPICASDLERAIKHSWVTGVGLCENCPDSRQCETESSMRAIGCLLSLNSMMCPTPAGPEATPSFTVSRTEELDDECVKLRPLEERKPRKVVPPLHARNPLIFRSSRRSF
jgi:hypothetical protein